MVLLLLKVFSDIDTLSLVVDIFGDSSPHFGHIHLVLGKSTGLVRADVVGTSHDLARSDFLDEVLLLKHLLN